MGALVSFFAGGPARIQALLVAAMVALAVCLALLAFGLWWRGEAFQARAERDLVIAQGKVLADKLQTCNAGADQAKAVGDAAIAAMGEMLDRARKLAGPREKTIVHTETVIHQAPKPGEGCDWAWDAIEAEWARRAK